MVEGSILLGTEQGRWAKALPLCAIRELSRWGTRIQALALRTCPGCLSLSLGMGATGGVVLEWESVYVSKQAPGKRDLRESGSGSSGGGAQRRERSEGAGNFREVLLEEVPGLEQGWRGGTHGPESRHRALSSLPPPPWL